MIKNFVKKINILIDDYDLNETHISTLSEDQLKNLYDLCINSSKDLVEEMYLLWKNKQVHVDGYTSLIVKNQISKFIKGKGKNYSIYLWYFLSDEQPYYIELRKNRIVKLSDTMLSIINDYPSNSILIKDNLSEMKAQKIKKQIEYFSFISNIHLIREEEV
ncbi:MAG: hypothetical protein AB7E09_00630 [Candidatus Izemoplasmatales bacterium]